MLVTPELIAQEYERLGHNLGWRWLMTPLGSIQSAQLLIVTLNPGGRHYETPEFSVEGGNAYLTECWRAKPAGKDRLQVQIGRLIDLSSAEADRVCIVYLVPFRSQNWGSLANPTQSLSFGIGLLTKILQEMAAHSIVLMGRQILQALKQPLSLSAEAEISAGWGRVVVSRHSDSVGRRYLTLPHLSRFPIVGRSSELDQWLGQTLSE